MVDSPVREQTKVLFEANVLKQAAMFKSWNLRKIVLSSDGTLQWFSTDKAGKQLEFLNSLNLSKGSVKIEDEKITISASGRSFSCKLVEKKLVDELISACLNFATVTVNGKPCSPKKQLQQQQQQQQQQHLQLQQSEITPSTPQERRRKATPSKIMTTSTGKMLVKVYIDPILVQGIGLGTEFLSKSISLSPNEVASTIYKEISIKLRNPDIDFSQWNIVLSSGKMLDPKTRIPDLPEDESIYLLHKTTNRSDAENLFYQQEKFFVREGWLQKKGQQRPNWKSRYFVLDKDGNLCYYSNEQKVSELGSLSLRGSAVTQSGVEITIKTGSRTLFLVPDATHNIDCDIGEWFTAFQHHTRPNVSGTLDRSRASVSHLRHVSTRETVLLKIYIEEKLAKELSLSDRYVVKSISIPARAPIKEIKDAVASKVRADPLVFEPYLLYSADLEVYLDENSPASELDNGSRIFILHPSTDASGTAQRCLDADRIVTREGLLQKKGQQRPNWKTRYFQLSPEGVLRYYSKENCETEKGCVYTRGAAVIRCGGNVILIRSVTGRELYLRPLPEGIAAFEEWESLFDWNARKAPNSDIATSLKAYDTDESACTTESGPLVRIKVTSEEGTDVGYVMGRGDGHFALYKATGDVATGAAFQFRKYRRKKFSKASGTKAWNVNAYKNIWTGFFISRSQLSYKLKGHTSFGDTESFDTNSKEWKLYAGGIADPVNLTINLKDLDRILRYGGKSPLSFTEEIVTERDASDQPKDPHEWTVIRNVPLKESKGPVSEEQKIWDLLATYLLLQKLKQIKSLPHTLDCVDEKLQCPGLPEDLAKVHVLKRFNSRKLPHLIEFEDQGGNKKKFIFKEDDDISMDMTVMDLLRMANQVWKKCHCQARIKTYTVVATVDSSGFCECISGDTMLKFDAVALDAQLGLDREKWDNFFSTLIAVITSTCAFDITDRHHNNVMFSPEGEVCLIDLSASLGFKAPMDSALSINPVYFPDRFLKLREYYVKRAADDDFDESVGNDFTDWYRFEGLCMGAYYALFNDPNIRAFTGRFHFDMPTPVKFLKFLTKRKEEGNRGKEALRNQIVTKMEENDTVARVVATITSVIPMN